MQLYDHLLQFPLFQGMSRDSLAQVAGHTRFGFHKFDTGAVVAREADASSQLFFLLSGTLGASAHADDHGYQVTEQLQAPFMFQTEALFGYSQRFTHTFTTLAECSFITIDKAEVMRLSDEFLVFRLNLLNVCATQTQKQLRRPWHPRPTALQECIGVFLAERCLSLQGPKTLHILMTRLARELGCSRLEVSQALNALQAEGLLRLHRGRVEVPHMEHLLASFHNLR